MVNINPTISIITLNINGVNTPIKRQKLSEWNKKQDPTIYYSQETQFKYKDTYSLKVNGWRKIYHVNANQKKAGVAILTSDRADLRAMKSISERGHT